MRFWLLVPLLNLLAPSIVAGTDYHYTVRHIWNGHPTDAAYWISGDKSRTEHRSSYTDAKGNMTYGPRTAMIIDRGNRQIIELDLDDREYATHELRVGMTEAEIKRLKEQTKQIKEQAAKTQKPTDKGSPTVTIETNTVDTGERQMFFGHEARHFITISKTIRHHQPNAVDEQVTDGWYFDFYPETGYEPGGGGRKGNFVATMAVLMPGRRDEGGIPEYEFKRSGPKLPGMSVKQTVRFHQSFRMPDGSLKETTHVTETEIVDFSETPLDPPLFQVPPGFKRVDHINTQPPLPFSTRVHFWWRRMLAQLFH